MHLRRTVQLALCVTSIASAEAQADEDSYRWQLAATDGIALGLFALGGVAEGDGGRDTAASTALMGMGMTGYMLGGPVVHAAHGEWTRSLPSLAIRALLPGAGIAIAMAADECEKDDFICGFDYLGVGWMAGAVAASVLDVSLLGGGRADAEFGPADQSRSRLIPLLYAREGFGLAGLAGTF